MTFQVEGTNDSSCLSKCSTAQRGYFSDEFLVHFVNKCPRRAPLIHLGYSVRAVIINSLVQEFVKLNNNFKQIVSFGAGFDTLFFKLQKDRLETNIVYFELDLPRVIKRKIACIKKSDILKKGIGEFTECEDGLLSKNYKLLETDLRELNCVSTLFQNHDLDKNLPTLFLSECAITYIEEERSAGLIRLASEFGNATFVTYEQIHPDDGFGLIMLRHFNSLQSPLLSVSQHPTLQHQAQRYIQNNWEQCSATSALDAYNLILSEKERASALRLEPFDEWEEFYLKCLHYSVVIASKGSLSNWSMLCKKQDPPYNKSSSKVLKWKLVDLKSVSRYGHSTIQFKNNLILFGGFGVRRDGTHGRMNETTWLKRRDDIWIVDKESEAPGYSTMYSSWTQVTDRTYIVYGGRTSPMHCAFSCPEVVSVQDDGVTSRSLLVDECNRPSRWRHTAVMARREGVDTLVVFGGRTSDLQLLDDTWLVPLSPDDYKQQKVQLLPPQMTQPSARFSHSAAVRHTPSGSDEVWVCGGMSVQGVLADLYCLDLAGEQPQWRSLTVPGLLPRFGHSATVLKSRLVLVGGVNDLDNQQPGVGVIDLLSGTCVEYLLPVFGPEHCMLLINHSVVLSDDGNILYVVGGGGNCFSFGTYFNQHVAVIRLENIV